MWMFLVAVDNKSDIAVLSFVELWLIFILLAIENLIKYEKNIHNSIEWAINVDEQTKNNNRQKKNENRNMEQVVFSNNYNITGNSIDKNGKINNSKKSRNDYFKIAVILSIISWIYIWLWNLIKPTATFDFIAISTFISTYLFSILTWIWIIILILWIIATLKINNKEFLSNYTSKLFIIIWWVLSTLWITLNLKNKIKILFKNILFVLAFVLWFFWTLLITKGWFAVFQVLHWQKIKINSIAQIWKSILMWYTFPIKKTSDFTWNLFSWVDNWKIVWNTFNEDNWRYVWYWNKTFINPIWGIIIPKKYKETVCLWNVTNWCNITIKNSFNNKKQQKIISKSIEYIIKHYDIKIDNRKLKKEITNASKFLVWIDKNKANILYKKMTKSIINNANNKLVSVLLLNNINNLPNIYNDPKNKKILSDIINNWIKISVVSLPYKLIIPFNVTFNWSLQNLSSYYTDIWIIWLIIFWITIIGLFIFVIASLYNFIINIINLVKKEDIKEKQEINFFIWIWFAATLSWLIWLFIAEWIVWYNIWWIIWIIISFITLLFLLSKKDKILSYWIIWWVWIFILISLLLNFVRIWSQASIFLWTYKASLWTWTKIKLNENWRIVMMQDKKVIKQNDIFNMQFPQFKRMISILNNDKSNWKIIVWWTYIKYFINNSSKVIEDNFLTYLYKVSIWWNPKITYKRLKALWIKYLYISPNILSVIMWKWNVSIAERAFWKIDSWFNLTYKWVFPQLIDIANRWKIKLINTPVLYIKYPFIYKNKELKNILWIQDEKEINKIKYYMTILPYSYRILSILYPNKEKEIKKFTNDISNKLSIIIKYRVTQAFNWNMFPLASDVKDLLNLNISNKRLKYLLHSNYRKEFNTYTKDEKIFLYIWYNKYLPSILYAINNKNIKEKTIYNIMNDIFSMVKSNSSSNEVALEIK